MFRENQQIGLYTLIRKLGRGGFGEVWLAERKSKFVTTKVAVKLPLDEQVDHEAIKQEAQLWEQASGHPNVLPIIDADEYDGQIVIVSEYAPDGSLADKLKSDGKLSATQAVEMTIGILSGLSFLHSKGIIHRDIKPQNILLQGDTPRLADFGISRLMQATAVSSAIIGTDAYLAPESFEGKRNVQTDIWSVGVVLYQLLQGNLPFTQEHPSERMFAILTKDFPPLPDSIPQYLKNVIAKALAKQPHERYQQASEMREDLQRVLRGEAVSDFVQSDSQQTFPAEQVTQIRKNAPFSANHFQDENETIVRSAPNFEQGEKRKNSNVWMYATLALVLVSMIGFGVYFLANQSKQNNSNKNEVAQVSGTQPNIIPTNYEKTDETITTKVIENTSTTPLSTPEMIETSKVRLQYIFMGGSGCTFGYDQKVILITQNKSFNATTNGKGIATFNNVPCGASAVITTLNNDTNKVFKIERKISCSKNVNLGSFDFNTEKGLGSELITGCFGKL